MCNYAKTALTCYNAITPLINSIESVIKKKAKNSARNYSSCEKLADEIAKLIQVRLYLFDLKSLINEALSKLKPYDAILIKYKYFGIKPSGEFDHTSRNYFRKQIKALSNFTLNFQEIGVSEEWFQEKYLTIPFILNVHKKILKSEGKRLTQAE